MKKSALCGLLAAISIGLWLPSCKNTGTAYDAGGTLEAVSVTVSAKGNGTILRLDVAQGDRVEKDSLLGYIDTTQLHLQKEILRLKLDDMRASAKRGAAVSDNQIRMQELQIEQVQVTIEESGIASPFSGTVTECYVQEGEQAYTGRPLFKVADLENMILKAYVDARQLSSLRMGQDVKVYAMKDGKTAEYAGTLVHIADQAEFTPKSLQTQNERANLVYAVKIRVQNDGYLKIGMYADVNF
ncbi:MAG: efflux RND transporter periplasmic adaptor subunit [Bacteroidales bacterium]|nr:efflux RND transporter periplasmic adaptor subunit [Bacteroidales bacterium]